jgi:hypothetical protein
MKKLPELKIEANMNGITRIRCLFSGDAQKQRALALAARVLPVIARLDAELRKQK